jgi:hypothetical protein
MPQNKFPADFADSFLRYLREKTQLLFVVSANYNFLY